MIFIRNFITIISNNQKYKMMKKITFCLMMIMLSLNTFSNELNPEKNVTLAASNTKDIPADVKVMLNRLEEIKAMDKSELNYSEKKELRKEVRAINSTLRTTSNGIYLSVGAIIIILLILILIL